MTEPDGIVDAAVIESALTTTVREESGRVLALLARRYGDLDLADESVQDALEEAARVWPSRGVPKNPAGWLFTVANNKAIDRLRRRSVALRTSRAAARIVVDDLPHERGDEMIDRSDHVDPNVDERLRLMLLCCHPALDRDAQVALTLRLVGGLQTPEIAAAFLVTGATLAQRIVRAKRKIRDARIPMSIPDSPEMLHERVGSVLGVLYLIFNEGYLSRGSEAATVQVNLMDEAIRLTLVMRQVCPESAEAAGLLALELFQRARAHTRVDHAGDLVLLEDQDRSQWDLRLIASANVALAEALARMQPGEYQVQAIIASHHANARSAQDTDWPAIERHYRQLKAMTNSPVVGLNHAVAVAMAAGPDAGLDQLDAATADGALDGYHLAHATRGELLARTGRRVEALESFRRALPLTASGAERRHLERRIAAMADPIPSAACG